MRDFLRQLRRAVTMPPGELTAKVRRKLRQRSRDAKARERDRTQPTFLTADVHELDDTVHQPLARLISSLDASHVLPERGIVAEFAGRALAHEFDLLGSGWTHVVNTHGLQVTEANRAEAERVVSLLPDGYTPIDWHVDFKSDLQHRWDPLMWYRDQPQVVGRGIDVKLPWELARMQHLPMLAWGYALADAGHDVLPGEPDAGLACDKFREEFRAQVLDFIAHNPPRFGINWNCAMDVGIRVAGWVLTLDLFRAAGASFDDAFLEVLTRSVREHADHLAGNLEWDERIRANHYLADLAGLLVASAYLPADETTDAYLHFAARELIAETLRQFHEDGSNFEASTSYHRLSAEMVVYGLAVLQGVTPTRRDALVNDRRRDYRPGQPPPRLTPRQTTAGGETLIPSNVIDRIARMSRFTEDLLDRHGRDPQIGDNDNGRFFKLLPATMRDADGVLREDTRYHRHLIDAVDGFFKTGSDPVSLVVSLVQTSRDCQGAGAPLSAGHSGNPLPHGHGSLSAETEVVGTLLGGTEFDRPALPPFTDHVAYPGMGLYLYKHGRLTTIVRCGEVGQNGNGGHAHDDQLSFVMYVDGEPLVIDPGTGCYTADPEVRNKFRSALSHNGPIMQERGLLQWLPGLAGLFQASMNGTPRVAACRPTTLICKQDIPQHYSRCFWCEPDHLQVVGAGPTLEAQSVVIHLADGVRIMPDNDKCTSRLITPDGTTLWLRHLNVVAREQPDQYRSASYGEWSMDGRSLVFTYNRQCEGTMTWSFTLVEPDV